MLVWVKHIHHNTLISIMFNKMSIEYDAVMTTHFVHDVLSHLHDGEYIVNPWSTCYKSTHPELWTAMTPHSGEVPNITSYFSKWLWILYRISLLIIAVRMCHRLCSGKYFDKGFVQYIFKGTALFSSLIILEISR